VELQALIFDVDGTLAETEDAHRRAFNQVFREYGFDWTWGRDLYRDLLKVTGGRARIRHYLQGINAPQGDGDTTDALIREMHQRKNAVYAELLAAGQVPLRPGIETLFRQARTEGLRLAIATTTSPENITALLRNTLGEDSLNWFEAIGTGASVKNLKPAPDVYLWVLEQLNLAPEACLAFEDSENGLRSSRATGIKTVVSPCLYTLGQNFSGAVKVVESLEGVNIAQLRRWHRG